MRGLLTTGITFWFRKSGSCQPQEVGESVSALPLGGLQAGTLSWPAPVAG